MGCLLFHRWNGCKCAKCGKLRDEAHDWNGCTCRVCGKKRDEAHDWNGCTCRICGKKRDEAHDWNGCTCRVCGKKRDEEHLFDYAAREMCEGTCKRCGKKVSLPHDYQPAEGKCYQVCSRCHGRSKPEHRFKEVDACAKVCEVCGLKIETHRFEPVPGKNLKVCAVCGKEEPIKRNIKPAEPKKPAGASKADAGGRRIRHIVCLCWDAPYINSLKGDMQNFIVGAEQARGNIITPTSRISFDSFGTYANHYLDDPARIREKIAQLYAPVYGASAFDLADQSVPREVRRKDGHTLVKYFVLYE